METPKWYVVRTEPSAEYQAASELTREGYEIFFPTVKSPHNRLGHPDTPLFPGYLFLRHDPETSDWPSFRPAHRIAGWVRFDGVIPSVSDDVIADLEQRVAGIYASTGLWRRYRRGEAVQVVSGHLESIGEVVEEAKTPEARALVLLQFMGRLVQARIPWSDLQPITPKPARQQPPDKVHAPRRTRGGGRWVRGFGPESLSRGLA